MAQHSSVCFGVGDVARSDGSKDIPTSVSLPHQDTSLAGWSEAAPVVPKGKRAHTATKH